MSFQAKTQVVGAKGHLINARFDQLAGVVSDVLQATLRGPQHGPKALFDAFDRWLKHHSRSRVDDLGEVAAG